MGEKNNSSSKILKKIQNKVNTRMVNPIYKIGFELYTILNAKSPDIYFVKEVFCFSKLSMTVLKIGKGFGPCIFSIIEPSLFIIMKDGVSVNPREFAKAISLSINDSYFLVS